MSGSNRFLQKHKYAFPSVKTIASQFCPSQNKLRSKLNREVHYRLPENLNELFYHLRFNSISTKAFSFLLPVIMTPVSNTVPKIKMIFYMAFLYTEDETKTCLQDINKNNSLSQVMLRSTVYTQHKTRQFFAKAAG